MKSAIILFDMTLPRLSASMCFADSASGDYLWDVRLLDAMMEFGGRPVGLAALQMLEGY